MMSFLNWLDDRLIIVFVTSCYLIILSYHPVAYITKRLLGFYSTKGKPAVTDPPVPHVTGICPICCHEPPILAIGTICGHLFCGECLMELSEHRPSRLGFKCPMCRSKVSILFEMFSYGLNGPDDVSAELRTEVSQFVRRYNCRQSMIEIAVFLEFFREIPVFLRQLVNEDRNFEFRAWFSIRLILTIFPIMYVLRTDDVIITRRRHVIATALDDFNLIVLLCYDLAILYRTYFPRQEA